MGKTQGNPQQVPQRPQEHTRKLRNCTRAPCVPAETGFALASLGLLAEKKGVHVRFLLGPAGSGKTFRCLEEIRAELLAAPEGPPLVLLAPKQATFQLERQLLSGGTLPGYTRLHILSFERLADFILRQSQNPPRELLSEEGRTMVLRALLMRQKERLRIFRASAGLSGFAKQLSVDLRELQRHQLSPEKLDKLATVSNLPQALRHKLHDFGILLREYLAWVQDHNLEDGSRLLDLAAESLSSARAQSVPESEEDGQGVFSFSFFHGSSAPSKLRIAGLWLDGFAEMTPQELSLLAALAPHVDRLTLAFCVNEEQVRTAGTSWLSIWSGVNQTRVNCQARLSAISGATFEEERLPGSHPTRFAQNPALAHLERHWARPQPFSGVDAAKSLRLVLCPNPQAEAVMAAREIRRFLRAGGRYREAAVLLRSMNGYHDELRRVFSRYEIPFFLDRRESVSHHPLAELTRCALSTLAFNWRHEDWFGALKTGLISDDENAIDQMENEALARGWKGDVWLAPLPAGDRAQWANRLRERWIAPFLALRKNLSAARPLCPSGRQLGEALRLFWQQLRVEETLEQWSATTKLDRQPSAPHTTVWEQLNAWVDDIARAFAEETMPLHDWLPVLEAGLSGLSVGVIPPALDQVLIGTVDRSRNPELQLTLLLGANESVFPAAPVNRNLLTDADRDALERCEIALGQNTRQLLSRERFLGYIACTRSRGRLVLSASQRDAKDAALNPSPFFSQLKAIFPTVEIEQDPVAPNIVDAEHACELIGPLLRSGTDASSALAWPEWPLLTGLRERVKSLVVQTEGLSPALASRIYGPALKTSVSRLENYAACPFKFFLDSGLGAEERRHFELDVREKGSFQHAVLAEFHALLRKEGLRWHDLTPAKAREKVGVIADRLAPQFREGLLQTDAQTRFAARAMKTSLQDFVATLIGWMPQYDFEPEAVELGFGQGENSMPAWELELGDAHRLIFRGIIDRIDLCPIDDDSALAVVIDYKSSARKLDKLMMQQGLQLQLLAYLSVLRHLPQPEWFFKVKRLIPGGVFYVNLRGQFESGKTRTQVLGQLDETREAAYQHTGRFDGAILPHLDNRCLPQGTQFKFKIKKDGQPSKQVPDLMASEDFDQLLDSVEKNLVRMGREIFAGSSQPAPYQKGKERACDKCDFAGICRIDPWTHKFRVLRDTAEAE